MQQNYLMKNISIMCRKITFCLLLLLINFGLNAQVVLDVQDAVGQSEVTVPINVTNYTDIVSIQFSINFDHTHLQLDGITAGDIPITNWNVNIAAGDGLAILSYFDIELQGESLEDGETLIALNFTILNSGTSVVEIVNTPTPVEIVNINDEILPATLDSGIVTTFGAYLSGSIYQDTNDDCVLDSGEGSLANWAIHATSVDNDYVIYSDSDGNYSQFIDTGIYTLTLLSPNQIWDVCPSTIADITTIDTEVFNDFGAQATLDCSILSVDIATPFVRRCFPNTYTITYCNMGTIPATDAYVIVNFPEFVSVTGSSIPSYDASNNDFGFVLGDLAVGECGTFKVFFEPICDETEIGQTLCTEAEIFPQDPCLIPPGWSGASIALNVDCDGENVNFTIENVGTGDMQESLDYIVIEDAVMMIDPTSFSLNSGQDLAFQMPANGSTYRLQTSQVAEHPGMSMPSITIEGCGENDEGNFSTGFVTQFAADESDLFVAIDCQEMIGSFDPNDKAAFPKGKGPEHYIDRNIDLEYKIRFQNTGTDTAFTVVVIDTLSTMLDPITFRPGASSHPYELVVLDQNIVQFTFNNIELPDSNVNEAASHGFVQFKIAQQMDLPYESVINNNAAIYFDFNDPIITNTTFHTIEAPAPVNTAEVYIDGLEVQVFPNPFKDKTLLLLSSEYQELKFTLYNLQGQLVQQKMYNSNAIEISGSELISGTYFYKLNHNGLDIASGKVMLQK